MVTKFVKKELLSFFNIIPTYFTVPTEIKIQQFNFKVMYEP